MSMPTKKLLGKNNMYANLQESAAVHWWSAENKPDPEVRALLPFLFENLDSLYFSVSNFPNSWSCGATLGIQSGGTHGMYFKMGLPPDMSVLLRSAISLSGDIYCILKRLGSLETKNLGQSIASLTQELEKFRALRNFFAHFDDRISDLDRHGITGVQSTNCGINYTENAKGCFHMAIVGNIFHFSSNGKAEEVDVGKESFLKVLHSSRAIYKEITSHKIHQSTYPPSETVYA